MNALLTYARMIKLSHSVFALPFALAAVVLASREVTVTATQVLLVVGCMVAARSSAMGFNRIVDRHLDASNPRTAGREIPTGRIGLGAAWTFTLGSAGLFVLLAALLGPLPLALTPIALGVIWGYSLTKRFTALCHLVLGLALALAPSAAWIAVTGSYGLVPLLLSIAVATWVAGFDILYALQDEAFDRSRGLYSIPVAFGVRGALRISAALHVVTVLLLAALPALTDLGIAYPLGLLVVAGVLTYEHAIVKPDDLSRIDAAFFDLNGYVSSSFLLFVWLAT